MKTERTDDDESIRRAATIQHMAERLSSRRRSLSMASSKLDDPEGCIDYTSLIEYCSFVDVVVGSLCLSVV